MLALLVLAHHDARAGEQDRQSGTVDQGGLAPAGSPGAASAEPAAASGSPALLLYGVVIVEPGNSLAFIHDGNSHSQIRRVREGQTIAGARVKAIFPDRVMLVYRGAEIDLRLWSTTGSLPDAGLSEGDSLAAVVSPRPLSSAELSKPLIYRQRLYPQNDTPAQDGPEAPEAGFDDETNDNYGREP